MDEMYDLIVAGGGVAGVAAAVSAAREGLRVLLAEQTGVTGGAMTNALVYPFMRYTLRKSGRVLAAGLFAEMQERWKAYRDTSWETYKLVFDDLLSEAGAEVLFHAQLFDVTTKDRQVTEISVATCAGKRSLRARMFIDATGDGELFYLAGCDCQLGRQEDGFCQPMTTCFRLGNVDIARFQAERPVLEERYRARQAEGKITNPRENILVFFGLGEGIVHFNTTRVIRHDPTDPAALSRAEMIARRQVWEMVKFLREESEAFSHCTLLSLANRIGVRESRKLKGVHILTAEELERGVYFPDTVALGNYGVDIHNPTGTGTTVHYLSDEAYYSIPYRSLLPKEYDNLLVAGRCLSATHEAQSAVRIMPTCVCMGQAAGIAAAVAAETGTALSGVDTDAVRRRLTERGAVL